MTTTTEPFADLPGPIASALEKRGFSELSAVQRAVVDAESEGFDLRISSQTGSGKTVAIGLALAPHFISRLEAKNADARSATAAHPSGLVIVPTRELAAQVREELRWLYEGLRGLKVEVVTGGTSIEMERRALARGPSLVVGTPGRLLDHMRNNALICDSIAHVVLDEADQMLDMGFREELEGILDQLPSDRKSHLVSATFPRAVQSLASQYQQNVLTIEGTQLGVANADIHHIAYSIRRHETYAALVNVLLMAGDSRCLLFVNRRVDATELAEKLASDGFGAAPFSGELAQAQRTRTLAAFRNGTFNILVSTDVAARGIDVPDISTVVHVDPPRTSDAYVHRSGRTGRAGQTGKSILLVVGPETRRVARMLQYARIEVSWQPIPQPEKVQKALIKQSRRELHERLAEGAPTENQLLYAKTLLEERDPAEVVATLLEMARRKPPCEPKPVVGLDPYSNERPGRRGAGAARGADRRDDRGRRDASASFTNFSVSWGEQTGATTSRILSHVCRRGGLVSHQVGSIKVSSKSTVVGIASDTADAFAKAVRRPDPRDPGIVIRRIGGSGDDRGTQASSAGRPSGPANGKGSSGPSGPPSGPARDGRRPHAKRPGRPPHLKRKQSGNRASR